MEGENCNERRMTWTDDAKGCGKADIIQPAGKKTDRAGYAESLIERCAESGELDGKRLGELKAALDRRFCETARQYTRGESGSVSGEEARRIMRSLIYQLDVCLLSMDGDADAISALQSAPPDGLFERGQRMILLLLEQTKAIFRRAYAKRLDVGCTEYRYAMDEAFDVYCARYSARFDAENCVATVDYPLLCTQAYELKSSGVLFMREYYTALLYENDFCSKFERRELERLLRGYGKIYGCDYRELLFNICEVVLVNAMAAKMLGKPEGALLLGVSDIEEFTERYSALGRSGLAAEANTALERLCPGADRFSSAQRRYLGGYIVRFADMLARRFGMGDDMAVRRYIVVEG